MWWLGNDSRLSNAARDAIANSYEPLVSAGTLFEVSVKASIGKLEVPANWAEELLAEGFGLLPILPPHASRLSDLPFVEIDGKPHRDPFDRLLVAQSMVEGVPVVTRDPFLGAHGVPTIW